MTLIQTRKSLVLAIALIGAISVPALANRTHRAATAGHTKTAKKKNTSHQLHGQRQIDSDRAREIQTALIREHYLTGEPTGEWDSASQAAMSKFQSDNGWQTKLTPDSRALIKLGLGPNQETGKVQVSSQSLPPATGTSSQSVATMGNSFADR
jgi:hypothetical protein